MNTCQIEKSELFLPPTHDSIVERSQNMQIVWLMSHDPFAILTKFAGVEVWTVRGPVYEVLAYSFGFSNFDHRSVISILFAVCVFYFLFCLPL